MKLLISRPGQAEVAELSFSYKLGTFTEEFGEAIGRFGARTPVIVQSEATVGELVQSHCGGGESLAYRRAVAIALRDQKMLSEGEPDVWKISLSIGTEVNLPPCLPEPIPDLLLRIVRPAESISQIYQSARSWEALADVWNSGRADYSEVSRTVQRIAPSLAFATADSEWHSMATQRDNLIVSWPSALRSEEVEALNSVDGRAQWSSTWDGTDDLSSLSKIRALQQDGVSDTEAIDTVAMAQAFNEKDQGVADARQALEQALALYRPKSDYYQLLQQTIANPGFVKSLQSFDAGKYDDIFIEFNPHRGSRSPNELKVGELVFAPTVSRQSVLIPLAVPMEALDDATRRVLTSNILVDGQVAIDAQIQEGIVGVFGIDEHECSAPPTPQERRRAANQLSLQLLQNRIHDLRENRGARLTSTILVADSGFYYDDRFTGVPFRDGHLQSTLQHEQERPSIGFTSPSDATHGTSVSGLVLGGPDLIDRANALGYEVKLDSRSIYRLVGIERDQAGQLLRDHEGNTTERYVALAIPKKVQRALERGNADVVNLSLGGQLQEFESPDFLRNHTALFVIAAGNYGTVTKKADAGVDVGQHDIYPARYGGSGGDGRFNLLTVAALDWNGTLASFSNYGQQEVQIAAFGCGVPTWTYNLDQQSYHEARLSGTSFAAPAVSYVAGLLIASLPPRWAQAARVKARLLASADLEPSLFEKIEDGRVLNPFKALSLYDDVLEELVLDDSGDSGDPGPSEEAVVDEATREIPDDAAPVEEDEVRGEVLGQNPPRPTATVIHRGELKKGRSLDEFCQFVSQPDDTYLLKVAQHPDRNKRGLLRYYWIKGEELEFDECEPKENLAIAIETSTGSRVVPWDRVKDIVFRYPFD